jgi:hypothetical protein
VRAVAVGQERRHAHVDPPIGEPADSIGTTAATSLITNLTNDLYTKAKQLLLDRKAKGRHRRMGFVIYGPDGKELYRWDTEESEQGEINTAAQMSNSIKRGPRNAWRNQPLTTTG